MNLDKYDEKIPFEPSGTRNAVETAIDLRKDCAPGWILEAGAS